MKLRAWMWYLIGIIIVFPISMLVLTDPFMQGSLVGQYVLYGGIALGLYYLSRRLWFGKTPKSK